MRSRIKWIVFFLICTTYVRASNLDVLPLQSSDTAVGKVVDTLELKAVATLENKRSDTFASSPKTLRKFKKGWVLGAVPSISYDTDMGFQFGAIGSLYYYGDGTLYPQYMHSIYVEVSGSVKGSGIFRLNYDSKYLIPDTRLTIDATYMPDNMYDFFGFNGFEAVYNKNWTDQSKTDYLTRAFYKVNRSIFRFAVDVERKVYRELNWNLGIGILNYTLANVNIAKINKNKAEAKKLPDTNTLYDYYKMWNILDPAEAKGGLHPYLRGGFTYDTRDRLINPQKGIWGDAFVTYYAAFGNQSKYQHLNLNLGFRHYVTLLKNRIVFAYRVIYQQTIAGNSPYYLKNYNSSLFIQRAINDALGGSTNLRGVMRNRVVGDGFAYANIEFRFRVWNFTLFKQYFYLGFNPFFDIGYIIAPVKYDKESVTAEIGKMALNPNDFFGAKDSFHATAGIGLKAGWNENFVLSIELAKAFRKQDGNLGFYIVAGYLF
ncbi:MAG: hypothetical protein RR328_01035 [Bacteroidales bacterium]